MKRTEKEITGDVGKSLFIAEQKLSRGQLSLEDISDIIPGHLHLNNVETIALEYVNKEVSDFFEMSMDDINANAVETLQRISHPADLQRNNQMLSNFLGSADSKQTVSFFQRLRRRQDPKDDYTLHLTATKLFGSHQSISITIPVSNLDNIAFKISDLLDENQFLKKNFARFATLTKREKEILTLLARGYNNPRVAEVLFISRRTVENHRKSIIRKLDAKHFADLMRYARAFDLI